MRLKIKATEPQARFLTLDKRYRLFCAGYGAGKSEAMANAALMDACQSSDALIACYAPTYDLVRLITAPRIQSKLIDHGIQHTYNKAENVIYTSAPGWGDLILRTMDNPERIVGYESYRAHLDELDTLKFDHAAEVWNKVIARNRQRPRNIANPFNQVSAYTTPEGFRFAHWRWVVEAGEEYGIVQAPSYSNPYLPPSYLDSLRATYKAELVEAYIEGRFVNLTSGTVYNTYNRVTHDSKETVQEKEPLRIGMDFNVGNMSAVVYVMRGEAWHAVDELKGIFDTPSMIDTIQSKYPEHNIRIYPDASGRSRKSVNASVSDISLLQSAGFTVYAKKQNPPVKDRVISANMAFTNGKLYVNSARCPELARCFEQLAYDDNGEPDKKSNLDHLPDAATYPIVFEMPVKKPATKLDVRFAR